MAVDWFISWAKQEYNDSETSEFMKIPDVETIKEVLEDYLDDLCEEITEHHPGFLSVKLRGKYSRMFQRHGGVCTNFGVEERWFEIRIHDKGMTVTTRMADDVTMGLAANFAKRCAQRWDGDLNEPS